jgi:hypothetical protein
MVSIVEGIVSVDQLFFFDVEQVGHKLVVFETKSLDFGLQVVVMVCERRIIDCGLQNKFLEIAPEKDAASFEIRSRLVVYF